MRNATIAAGLLGCTLLMGSAAHAQAARHYDCTKAGNANKAACKGAAPAPAKSATTATATTTAPAKAERHYDCSKAGNANKAACKGASPPSVSAATTPAPAAKPSLLDRLRGRKVTSPATAAASAAPAATSPATAARSTGKGLTTDPAGATGQCKDGSYTHATHHSGACSHHGGVAKWMNG